MQPKTRIKDNVQSIIRNTFIATVKYVNSSIMFELSPVLYYYYFNLISIQLIIVTHEYTS